MCGRRLAASGRVAQLVLRVFDPEMRAGPLVNKQTDVRLVESHQSPRSKVHVEKVNSRCNPPPKSGHTFLPNGHHGLAHVLELRVLGNIDWD